MSRKEKKKKKIVQGGDVEEKKIVQTIEIDIVFVTVEVVSEDCRK